MKVDFVVPVRNKAKFVGKTVDSILAQTYSPMRIVLSDQGSTDGSTEILYEKVRQYNGPNEVQIIHCPDTEYRGQAGLARHWNWLHQQIDGDLIIACAADDLNHPDRAKHTVAAFEEFNPSYIGTRVAMRNPDGSFVNETFFYDRRSRWIPGDKHFFEFQIGSAGSGAWARDLWDKHGPLVDCETQDMILPCMSLVERGFYFIDLPLHIHIMWRDPNNTGYDGRIRAAREGSREWYQLSEVNAWHNTSNWWDIVRRMRECGGFAKLPSDGQTALLEKATQDSYMWKLLRDKLTMRRIPPVNMEV